MFTKAARSFNASYTENAGSFSESAHSHHAWAGTRYHPIMYKMRWRQVQIVHSAASRIGNPILGTLWGAVTIEVSTAPKATKLLAYLFLL